MLSIFGMATMTSSSPSSLDPQSARLPNAQLTHIGLFVHALTPMVDFYCETLGMVLSDRGELHGRELAFLSRDPSEHHQLVMVCDPARTEPLAPLAQISFRLDDLEDLRAYYAILTERRAAGLEGRNHGNSWSIYFLDPEDNKIELYVPTPWAVAQPWRAPLDLGQPAAAIVAETAELLRANPTARPMADWSAEMRARLGAGGGTASR
jgi:catechol 2,3-dioxygenase